MKRAHTFGFESRSSITLLPALIIALFPDWLFADSSVAASEPGLFGQFLGRLHPLLVHLPIGMLFLAYLLEIFSRFDRFSQLKPATTFALVFGGLSAIVSVITGWFLSQDGGYQASTLAWHKWLGISVALSVIALAGIRMWGARKPGIISQSYSYLLGVNALLLVMAGHFGGSLTHGTGFVTSVLPGPIRGLIESDGEIVVHEMTMNDSPEDPAVFARIILPIFEDKCVQCHNPEKRKGKLELNTAAAILQGGKNGPIVVPGESADSELYRRITLPEKEDEHMPPEGKTQLADEEVRLIGWWLAEGASFEKRVSEFKVPADVGRILDGMAHADTTKEATKTDGVFELDVPPPDPAAMVVLRERGVLVLPISQQSNLLTVQYMNADPFTQACLNDLLPLAENIAWLDLSGTALNDSGLAVVERLLHLSRLHLERTNITDNGLKSLANLQYLEYLNLYGTQVSLQGLQRLAGLRRLKSVYLWQTAVTPDQRHFLDSTLSSAHIDLGYAEDDSSGRY
jgi:uncharacterized membrane protein